MYTVRFVDTPLYAQISANDMVLLVNVGQATHFPTKEQAQAAADKAGEFFAVEKLKGKKHHVSKVHPSTDKS